MENPIDTSPTALVTAGGDAANAAAAHGDSITLLHNTAPKIRLDIAALMAAINAYESAKAELSVRRSTVRRLVGDSRGLLTIGRDNLKPFLGSEHNEGWEIVGLTRSLSIPQGVTEMQPLLQLFKAYFVAHPGHEVDSRDITAFKFDELFVGLDAARSSVFEQELVVDHARQQRDDKADLLYKRLRGLVEELTLLLDPLDPLWKTFGFNMPGAKERPDVVENVRVTLINNTSVALTWDVPPRADYFHVLKKVVGVDQELLLVGSPTDPDFTLGELPANSTIEVAISALNNGGEGPASKVVKIVTQ